MTLRTITFDDERWQIVPREPTPKMLERAWRCVQEVDADNRMSVLLSDTATAHQVKMLNRWRAMLAVAPKPELE